MTDRYVLKGRKPIPEPDMIKWARWLETADRQVADAIQGDVRVSTVFLGLDHGLGKRKELFETMVFIDHQSVDCQRYATWSEAEAGHRRWVQHIFRPTPILTLPTGDDHGRTADDRREPDRPRRA